MELLRTLVIIFHLNVLVTSSIRKKSKCIQNFLKGQSELPGPDVGETSEEYNLAEVLEDLEGPRSEGSYLENIPSKYKECQYFTPGSFSPDPSFLIDFNNGRLGNQMSSLASPLCLARELGLTPVVTHRTFAFLSEYFTIPSHRAEVLEARLCSPWTDVEFTALERRRGTAGQVLVMPAYPNMIDLYPKYSDILKETFNFKEKYQQAAANFMNNLRRKSNFRNSTFISLHVRRTDQKYTFNGGRILTKKYYQDAIKLAKELYQEVIFIAVSDDLQWCKDNLEEENLFYTDNEDTVAGTGQDLALLTMSDHSVLSHGTFGLWGAMLAGGDIIAPNHYQLPRLGQTRKIHFI